jgi:hypothetical protein
VARFFRLWEKKRGERRTGSRLAGSLGEAAFFGSLFVLATIALATVLTTQWMTPDPRFLKLGFGTWLVLLVLSSLILIGGAGFILTILEMRASVERRSALVRRATEMELLRDARGRAHKFPSIPRDTNLTNSPGVKLAYRLPSLESPAWRLVAAAVTALACLSIAGVLIVIAIGGHQAGRPQLALTAFLVPFSSVTAWSVYYLARLLMLHAGIGPTSIEISAHPLRPGRDYEVLLVQSGHLHVTRLSLSLVCEEEAAFRQGTDIRTERREVYCREICAHTDVKIDPARPFEYQCHFQVPASAMHTFQSAHNAVQWKLVVHGRFAKWPEMVRSYPVIVHPPETEPTADGTPD